MKVRNNKVLGSAAKLVSVAALSAVLVACGGGTSGDGTGLDGDLDGGLGDLDTDINTGLDTELIDGLGTEELTDEELLGGVVTDGVLDPTDICQGLGGSDPGSSNDSWIDNCWLDYDIVRTDGDTVTRSPFWNSTYVMGVQRVLFCREAAGTASNVDAFADGLFGINTFNAIRAFQTAEGITVDGRVGPETWGKLQEIVQDVASLTADTDDFYNAYGVSRVAAPLSEIDCSNQTHFFAEFETDPGSEDLFGAWELARFSGQNIKDTFSINPPSAISASVD